METDVETSVLYQDDFKTTFSCDKEVLFYANREKARDLYLRQKPPCFIVIGKPSTGKTSLAKKLVKEMRCQYIQATHIIERNMKENTSTGKYFKEELLFGNNLSIQALVTLLKEATSLPECQHYGYVMDGFPSYLAFEEQLQLVESIPMKPDYVVYIEVPDEDLKKRLESQRIDPVDGTVYNFLNFDDSPGPFLKSTGPKSSKKQRRDDDILNLGAEKEEHLKGNKLASWHPEFPRLTKEVIDRLLIRPEDTKRELDKLFKLNEDVVQKSLNEFFKHFPKSHIIRIDGNCPPSQMFYNLMVKVRALPVSPAIPPFPLSLKRAGEDDEEYEEEDVENINEEIEKLLVDNESIEVEGTNEDENIDWDETIVSLSATKMPTEHSRWHLSEWQNFCPVQLYNGILEHGKVQFACGFLGFLYFLSSRDAMNKFIRNPRPYLDYYGQFQPKSPIRIAILGFRESGAASLCQLISEKCGAKLISLSKILKVEIEAREKETLEKIKNAVKKDLIDKLNKQRKRELDEIATNNIVDNAIAEIMEDTINKVATESLEEIIHNAMEHSEVSEGSGVEANEGFVKDAKFNSILRHYKQVWTPLLTPPRIEVFIPDRLKEPITEQHPQVVEAVDRALKFARAQPCYLEPSRYVDTLATELERLENENQNIAPEKRKPLSWVIEGLPPLEEVWELLKERSKEIYKQVNLIRHTHESLHKIQHLLQRVKKYSANTNEEGAEDKEEIDMNQEEEDEVQNGLRQTEEQSNPWAEQPDPHLIKAQDRYERAAAQNILPDPMPTHVFKLNDDLADHALMIHRLYKIGYEPFEGLESIPGVEGFDASAVEPMVYTKFSKTDPSRTDVLEEDDARTEPPEDPPISSQTFCPMPQPGPELDCVREQLVRYDTKWETVKENLSNSNTAYGFSVNTVDLGINKDQSIEDLLVKVEKEFKKLFAFQVYESSQEQLDEEYETERDGFAETGCLEENPADKEFRDEGTEEESIEEEAEENEGEEGLETAEASEDKESEYSEEEVEEEDPSRSLNRNLGVTNFFCPVAFHDHNVLKPGDPDLVATYKDRVYYFGTEESMSKFIDHPEEYVSEDSGPLFLRLPPLRIAILGPTGSGKTLHGRQIANQFDLIHVSFRQLLQDVMMMSKLKFRIGPEYADDVEISIKVMPSLEDEVKKALEKLENSDKASELQSAPKADESVLDDNDSKLMDLSPHEAAIRDYLENDEPLPKESLNLLLSRLWNQEPYRSKGFVLEGFPQTAEDVTYMLENNLLVDFVIFLNAEATDLLPRLLPDRLAKWKVKMAKIMTNKRIVADWRAEKKKRIREERRKILIKKINEKKDYQTVSQFRNSTEDADNEINNEGESDDEINISAILDEELVEEEYESDKEEEETDLEAKTRLEEEITERVEVENENIKQVVDSLTEARIHHFNILANDQLTRVRYRLVKKIKNYILNREAIFERVYPVTLEEADNLIASGFKHYSLFSRHCPVSWSRVTSARLPPLNPLPVIRYSYLDQKLLEYQIGDDILPNDSNKKSKKGVDSIQTCAAVYRECVYWFNSEEERKQFSFNPLAIIRAAGDMAKTLRHQPMQIAIIGDSDSEREQFSQQLAKNLRVPYITPITAVEWLLRSTNHSFTDLANKVYEIIKSGFNLPDDLIIKVLEVAFLSPQVQARGYILDNFPMTAEQANLLMTMPTRPMLVLDMYNKQCHHQAFEMNSSENINNEEPPDCPFLKIWLKRENRRVEGAGAAGSEGFTTSSDTNRRIQDYRQSKTNLGRSNGTNTGDRSKRDKQDGNTGSDTLDYDEFGNKIQGHKSNLFRQGEKFKSKDVVKESKHRGHQRQGSEDEESGTSSYKDFSKRRDRRKPRESEDSISGNAPSKRYKHRPNESDNSSYRDSQGRRRSSRNGHGKHKDGKEHFESKSAALFNQEGSRRHESDGLNNDINKSRSHKNRRQSSSQSSLDESNTKRSRSRRHRSRRLASSKSSDNDIQNGIKSSRKRKNNKDVFESSSSVESIQDGRGSIRYRHWHRSSSRSSSLDRNKKQREREEYSDSRSTLESDGERKTSKRWKHRYHEESDSSSDESRERVRRGSRKRGSQSSKDYSYSESTTNSSDDYTSSSREYSDSEDIEGTESEYQYSENESEISSSNYSEKRKILERRSRRSSKDHYILRRLAQIFKDSVRGQSDEGGREWLDTFNGLLVNHLSEDNLENSLGKALLVVTHRMAHFMEYEANKEQNKPMSISEIGMRNEQFEEKLGKFGRFCPVKLRESNELFDWKEEQVAPLVNRLPGPKALLPTANYKSALKSTLNKYESDITESHLYPHIPTELRFAVEYKGKTYRMAGPDELEKFMNDPEYYVQPNAPKALPDEKDLPKRLQKDLKSEDLKQLTFAGFCPVCYRESCEHYEGLQVGSENILAIYRDDIYAFCSEECRTKFMHRPSLYTGFKLPNKLPPKKELIKVDELPLPGYLEQTVANTLREALAACSKFRPKYPFLSPERSALIYLALVLKALNPRSPDYLRHRATKRIQQFEETSNFIDQLVKTMPVDYVPERQRSEAFNKLLKAFLSLRDQEDNENRWTNFFGD